MPSLDDETVERAVRWCAEAGRQTAPDEIRAALSKLSWDELLTARAFLADPPPGRPLGPFALADLARGVPADLAADRERAGRYRSEPAEAGSDAPGDGERPPPPVHDASRTRERRRKASREGRPVVIRRAGDRAPAAEPTAPAPRPDLADLFRPEGRNVLERLVRRQGARRAAIRAEILASHRAPEGVGDRELDALLEHHGLARAFAHRERDEILHLLKASGGSLGGAAVRLGLERAALEGALERLAAGAEAERIREGRRAELRHRSTLAERAAALFNDAPRLADLGLDDEFLADLRARLPEHIRALRSSGEAGLEALGRSLALGPAQAAALLGRLGLELPAAPPRGDLPRTVKPPARASPVRRDRREAPRLRRAGPGGGPTRKGRPHGRGPPSSGTRAGPRRRPR